jgi:hypothetical protein
MSSASWMVRSKAEENNTRWMAPRARWRERLVLRCAGESCPRRNRFWPGWVRASLALEFESGRYCSAACLQPALVRRLHALLTVSVTDKPRSYRIPLGLLLVRNGVLPQDRLREALRLQRESGRGRLGDWLRQAGDVTDQQLTAALAQQWGCPVYPLERQPPAPAQSSILPLQLLESARAFPAHANTANGTLHLAFADRLDHTTLYAAEQMLGCRVVACVASEWAIDRELARIRRHYAGGEPCFDTVRDPVEMARIVGSYSDALSAGKIAIARVTSHIWVRFHCRRVTRDLLFRTAPASPAPAEPLFRAKAFPASADTRKDGVPDANHML